MTNLRTHSTPVESMSDRILRLVRIWYQPFMDMLDICTIARATIRSPAVCNMNMPPHRRTDKIAHHWCPLITWREFTTSQFETRLTWPFNSPARLRHGSVAGFMFLLGVTLIGKHQHPERFSKIHLTKGQSTKIATVLAPASFKHHLVRKSQNTLTEPRRSETAWFLCYDYGALHVKFPQAE